MDIFIHPKFDDLYRRHPLVLADVGARGGLKKNWESARRHLGVLGFEPDKREYDRLQGQPAGDVPTTFFNVALHDRPGRLFQRRARRRADFHLRARSSVSRRFPDAGRFDTMARVEIDADTLTTSSRRTAWRVPISSKPTQGSELFCRGARRAGTSVLASRSKSSSRRITGNSLSLRTSMRLRPGLRARPAAVLLEAQSGRRAGPHGQIVWGDALT